MFPLQYCDHNVSLSNLSCFSNMHLFDAFIGHNSEDYIDSKGPDPSLRKGHDMTLNLGPKLQPKGPDAKYREGAGHVRIHGPNPLYSYGANCFKERKDEENRAKKDADNIGVRNVDCHIEVVDEAVWNDRQSGVCNTLMQALCSRPARIKETAM